MNEHEKQIVEQIAGVATSTADLSGTLVRHLVQAKALSSGEALRILMSLHAHQKDLAKRNQHLLGSALVYDQIADRLETHIAQLKKETGARAVLKEKLPDGTFRSREL
jgi:hypothetical protein